MKFRGRSAADHQVGIHHTHGRNAELAGLLGSHGGLGAMCTLRWPGASWGRGVGRNHRAQGFSLGQKGQEERRDHEREEGGGWRKDGERQAEEGFPEGLVRRPRLPALHTGRSAMAGGGRWRSAALRGNGILTQEVSAQAGLISLIALLTSLGPCHRCLRGGREEGLQWVWGQPGEVEGEAREEEATRRASRGRRAS